MKTLIKTARAGEDGRQDLGHLLGLVALALLFATLLAVSGCEDDECPVCLDTTPPPVPTGVFSVTGDGAITLYWNASVWEEDYSDLAAYYIYSSREGGLDATYYFEDEVAWDQNFEAGSGLHYYVFTEIWDPVTESVVPIVNGQEYYFAVSSVDARGNFSALSVEEVRDVPRPEGFDLDLIDYAVDPETSGFDFSRLESGVMSPDDPTTADVRILFDTSVPGDPVPYVESNWSGVEIQDFGTFVDAEDNVRLDWVDWAPVRGWSTTGRVELIWGHAYVVKIDDGGVNYAKFAVTRIFTGSRSVRIDWAYQENVGERELIVPDDDRRLPGDITPIRF